MSIRAVFRASPGVWSDDVPSGGGGCGNCSRREPWRDEDREELTDRCNDSDLDMRCDRSLIFGILFWLVNEVRVGGSDPKGFSVRSGGVFVCRSPFVSFVLC